MKKTSLVAILAAMLLAGCSSQEKTYVPESTGAAESGTSSTVAATGAESSGTSGASEPASVSSTAGTVASAASSAEPSTTTAPSSADPKPAGTTAATTPSGTTAATEPAATVAPEKHSDPTGADYTGKDIGGSPDRAGGATDDGYAAEADGIIMDFGMADAAEAVEGGAFCEPSACPPVAPGQIITPEAGLLTGGEWNDNDNWDFWQGLYNSENYGVDWDGYLKQWRTGADFRLEVTVKDSAGNLVSGAKVATDEPKYSAVTDNEGKAYLFYSYGQVINGFTELTVTFGDYSQSEKLTIGSDDSLEITLESEVKPAGKTLDLMIMCDTTGSMGDELEYLKEELEDVVTRIQKDNGNVPTRLSVNFYRDAGDEYVVREFPFTTDLDAVVNAISQQSANGGGDTPESVHTALDSAINDHDWDENSIKIMFLVLDAPPHEDVQVIDETVKLVKQAAEKGIRIVPVAASGVDKSCEYLLRSMAFMTGGTYTFLTDDSGIGFGHEEPTIGSYTVEKLNDMMVRICSEYLA